MGNIINSCGEYYQLLWGILSTLVGNIIIVVCQRNIWIKLISCEITDIKDIAKLVANQGLHATPVAQVAITLQVHVAIAIYVVT